LIVNNLSTSLVYKEVIIKKMTVAFVDAFTRAILFNMFSCFSW